MYYIHLLFILLRLNVPTFAPFGNDASIPVASPLQTLSSIPPPPTLDICASILRATYLPPLLPHTASPTCAAAGCTRALRAWRHSPCGCAHCLPPSATARAATYDATFAVAYAFTISDLQLRLPPPTPADLTLLHTALHSLPRPPLDARYPSRTALAPLPPLADLTTRAGSSSVVGARGCRSAHTLRRTARKNVCARATRNNTRARGSPS